MKLCRDLPARFRMTVVISFSLMWFSILGFPQSMPAQRFHLLHSFSGADGAAPVSGLTVDRAGNFYGTTGRGGVDGVGTVYELSPSGGTWVLKTLHSFQSTGGDGQIPFGRPVFGPDGTLFGLTYQGGSQDVGTIYNLKPPASTCRTVSCPWAETILFSFRPGSGFFPYFVEPVFDSPGNLYGTTSEGGAGAGGTIFQMARSNGGWEYSRLFTFDYADGAGPPSGVVIDAEGNLYGVTTQLAGAPAEVYQLSLNGSSWTIQILHTFADENIAAPLTMDAAGNLYGMTLQGTVFELTRSGGAWSYSVLSQLPDGGGYGALTFDEAGNIYGTQFEGGPQQYGAVFKLTLNSGSWTYTDLYSFDIVNGGAWPCSSVYLDGNGNLYGTASQGGTQGVPGCPSWGCGTVWELAP